MEDMPESSLLCKIFAETKMGHMWLSTWDQYFRDSASCKYKEFHKELLSIDSITMKRQPTLI